MGWEDDSNIDDNGSDQCAAFKDWPILFALHSTGLLFFFLLVQNVSLLLFIAYPLSSEVNLTGKLQLIPTCIH